MLLGNVLTNKILINFYRIDPKSYSLNVSLVIQKPIVLEGQYETNGRVVILPINGNGTCRFALGNLKLFNNKLSVLWFFKNSKKTEYDLKRCFYF